MAIRKGKQLYGYFKRQTDEISHKKKKLYGYFKWFCSREDRDVATKRKPERETESLLIAEQNNAIRTNDIKAKINYTDQNSKCRLYRERYETIIINKCTKLAQKGVQDEARLGRKDNLQGIVQEIKIWPYKQMAYAQTKMQPRGWGA